jgi:hypothetical protein
LSTDAGASPGAYGIAIESAAGLPGLAAASGASGGRHAEHRLVSSGQLAACTAGPRRALGGDGAGRRRIEYLQHRDGLLVRTASCGDHLLADGGRTVLSAIEGAEPELWRRYVVGQVLPLAASLQGLEIFHAGAVATAAGVLALAGPSGAGKSTLTAALVAAGGGRFFADDVLALELGPAGPLAFPGAALIGLPCEREASLAAALVGSAWAADEAKATHEVSGERRALPIVAFFLLAPDPGAEGVEFSPCPTERLLASTFDGVTGDRGRPLRLLAVAAALAESGAEELRYRPGADPGAVAAAVLARIAARDDG